MRSPLVFAEKKTPLPQPANVTERDIRSLFERHGAVKRFKMMTDRSTGLSRGFGFIQMKTDAEAEEAIGALNGTDLNGTILA